MLDRIVILNFCMWFEGASFYPDIESGPASFDSLASSSGYPEHKPLNQKDRLTLFVPWSMGEPLMPISLNKTIESNALPRWGNGWVLGLVWGPSNNSLLLRILRSGILAKKNNINSSWCSYNLHSQIIGIVKGVNKLVN